MADPRFFDLKGPFTLQELADATESRVSNNDGAKTVMDVSSLDLATSDQVSFLDNRKYVKQFETTQAGACFVTEELAERAPEHTVCLVSKNPYKSYALAAQMFYPSLRDKEDIHPSAVINLLF